MNINYLNQILRNNCLAGKTTAINQETIQSEAKIMGIILYDYDYPMIINNLLIDLVNNGTISFNYNASVPEITL